MAKLQCSEKLICKLIEMNDCSFVEDDIKTKISETITTRLMSVELLPSIGSFLKENGSDEKLSNLLIGSNLAFPSFKRIQAQV